MKKTVTTPKTHADILAIVDKDYYAVDEQRDHSNEDLRFCDVDGGQYDDWFREQFADRPKLEFNKVYQAVYEFSGNWRENRFDVKFRPEDIKATDDDADLMSGLFRKDFYRDNEGTEAFDNAVDEMAKCGYGAIKLTTRYVDEEDPEDDRQIVEFEPIYSAYSSVIWDKSAKKPDKSDARHVTVLNSMSRDAAEEEFGADAESAFTPPDRRRFNWHTGQQVWIAHHYELRIDKATALVFEDPLGRRKTVYKDEIKQHLEELADMGYEQVREKKVKRRTVWKSVLGGGEYLQEPRRIAGKHLPIIPLYGYRGYIDGQEFWYGIVRKYKDANRLFNMAATDVAENAATTSKDMPIFTDEQVEGREQQLREMHLGKYNYAVVNPVEGPEGEDIHMGPVGTWAASRVDPNNASLFTMCGEFMAVGMGSSPKEIEKASMSGVAVDRLRKIIDAKTIVLNDNIKKSMHRTGVVWSSIAGEVYDSERIEYILGQDGADKMVRLFDIVIDQDTGRAKFVNDITTKKFATTIDTGPAYASQRRETIQSLQEIGELATDDYKPLILGEIIELLDGVGMAGLKDHNRKRMVEQGLRKPETDEEQAIYEASQQKQQTAEDELLRSMAKKEMAEAQELVSQVQKNATQARLNTAKAIKEINGIKMDRLQASNNVVESRTVSATKQVVEQSTQPDLDQALKLADISSKTAKARKDNAEAEAQTIENDFARSKLASLTEQLRSAGVA
ncbi:portal protein [uncultured Paraglaciecola sp.]|mgnify:CR=1 FL=1|uniref:portal protein n=1 Tax=uncultured Paraglaciecola sp. TaxID=1765024 RepID=UPI00262F0A59|nr:portal protein [uncultured Paraglaciecola sp.]